MTVRSRPIGALAAVAVVTAVMVGLAAGLGACSGGSDGPESAVTSTTQTELPLTDAQASTMAKVLNANYRAGGASFTADLPARGEVVARLQGDVDWVGHVGTATYGTTSGSAGSSDYVWNPEIVLDGGIDGLEAAMAKQGRPGITWVSRPLDPTVAPLDGVLALLLTVSSDRPGNPQLIAQSEARYLGRRTVDGELLDAYRYGNNITYLVGVDDGLIHQIDASFKSYSDPVIIRFSDRGARKLPSPQKAAVVDASTIPDVYEELTGGKAPSAATPPPVGPTSTTSG